ncbi:MAG: response regulator [Myxococcota bacterium]
MARILVIDDSEVTRTTAMALLREGGHLTWQHASPLGATRMLFEKKISLVVLDMNMPAMSGERFAELLRSNPRLAHVRVVLITGADAETLSEAGARISADAMIRKENLTRELLPTINRLTQFDEAESHIA